MLVSIIIPMRDAECYIEKTLESIFCESHENLEVIIIDDGSTDNSLNIVRNFDHSRIHIIAGECKGIAAAFNKALDFARGEIIMRCDADDLFVSDRISWQLRWLKKNPEYDGVCSNFSMIDDSDGIVNDALNVTSISEEITNELNNGITRTSFCTYAIKTNILRKLNGCREYFITAEDIDLQLRIGGIARIWYEHKVSYLYRLHDTSITHSQQNNKRIFFDNMARKFQMQRLSTGRDDLDKKIAPSPPILGVERSYSANEHVVNMLIASSWELHRLGKGKKALARIFKALFLNPINYKIWKAILVMIIKK